MATLSPLTIKPAKLIAKPFKQSTMAAVPFKSKYDIKEELGRGAFSIVAKCIRKADGVALAVKQLPVKSMTPADVQEEVSILRGLKHPGVLRLYESVYEADMSYLVTDLLSGGELFDQILDRGSYTERDAAAVLFQVLDAISYLHRHNIVHRDLKPENLLCAAPPGDEAPQIVISDFGLARKLADGQTLDKSCGTPGYVAPEVIKKRPYSYPVDVWSIGVIAYILLCGYPPFYSETDNDQEIFDQTVKAKFVFESPDWDDVSIPAKQLITSMMTLTVDERITAEAALQDEWVKGLTASNVNIQERVSAQMRSHFVRKKWKKALNAQRAIQRMKAAFGAKAE
eukprot:m.94157 g.94157  ORF g.94157 m.94157 type:complete len:341 (+) comp13016_c0_seq2:641-1663(+)